jgi:hypothetical protein
LLDPEVWEHSSDYKPPPAADASIASIDSLSPVGSPTNRQYAIVPLLPFLLDHSATYVRLYPEHRSFEVVGPGDYIEVVRWRDFEESDILSLVSAADLPAPVTNERLFEFWNLQNALDELEREEDHYSSLPCEDDKVFVLPGLSEARDAYRAARAQLILDLYGPAPAEPTA